MKAHNEGEYSPSRSSLSMKLRSESVTTLSRPSTTFSSSSGNTLPHIRRKSSNIHLTAPIPQSDVAMMYEKLSGLYETQGFESFPARGTVIHPTTLCVRCSSHASLCVPCADVLAREAVSFFRKSQAVGAYHLLDGAIKQAGAEKVLKFMMFRIWKNSVKLRNYSRNKREGNTERAWELRTIRIPFRQWLIYTRECQFERKDKKIDQLEDRVKLLEQQIFKLSAEKNNAEKQVRKLLVEKSESELQATSQNEKIKELENVLRLEKSRVIRLARHVEASAPKMLGIAKSAIKSSLAGSVRHINLTQSLNLAALNLNKVLKTSSAPGAKSRDSKSTTTTPDNPSTQLLAWVNYMSKSAVGAAVKVASGESLLLDDFLPPIQAARSVESLKNGKQLARVVMQMVSQVLSVPAVPPKPPSSVKPPPPKPAATPTQAAASAAPPAPAAITTQQLQELKDSSDVPHGLLYMVFTLMSTYLRCPEFPLERIIEGHTGCIEVLVEYLLLAWTSLPGHTLSKEQKSESNKAQEKQASVLKDMESLCDKRCGSNTLKIAELTPPTLPDETKDGGPPPTGAHPQGEHDIGHIVMCHYDDETYTSITSALEFYLSEGGGAEQLSAGLSDLESGIRDVTDFTNSVYMKQKTAAAGLSFSLDAIKQQAMYCTSQMLPLSDSFSRNAEAKN